MSRARVLARRCTRVNLLVLDGAPPDLRRHQLHQRLAHQRRFPGSRDAGHRGHHAQREAHRHVLQVVARDALEVEPALRRPPLAPHRGRLTGEVARGLGLTDLRQPLQPAAVEHAPAGLARERSHVHHPIGGPDDVDLVLDDEDGVAALHELPQRSEQRARVRRVQPRRGLVEHVHDAEEVGADLRREPQALQLTRRERGRAAVQREVAEPEFGDDPDPRQHVGREPLGDQRLLGVVRAKAGMSLRGPLRGGTKDLGDAPEGEPRQLRDVEPCEGDREGLALEPLALAERAAGADEELRHPPLEHRALGVGEGLHHVAPCAGEGAHVRGRLLPLQRAARLGGREPGVDRDLGLVVGEEDPVAVLLRKVPPRPVHVEAEGHEDVAQVLAVPRRWPRGDRALADGERGVRHHRGLGGLEEPPEAVTLRARPGGRVGRERLRLEVPLALRIGPRARVEQAQRVGDRGHAPHRRPRGRRAARLLQRHRGWQPVDGVHLRHAHLIEQPARIGRNRLEEAPLGLGEDRPERERRLPRPRDAGEHHQRIARDVHVHVLQVVLASPAHAHAAGRVIRAVAAGVNHEAAAS